MEEHAILSERLEDQLKAVEWAKAEQKKILNLKYENLFFFAFLLDLLLLSKTF